MMIQLILKNLCVPSAIAVFLYLAYANMISDTTFIDSMLDSMPAFWDQWRNATALASPAGQALPFKLASCYTFTPCPSLCCDHADVRS